MRALIGLFAGLVLGSAVCAGAQFDIEDSHTTASLRGIHSLGDGVAWASGANGTVLRTVDGGSVWQACAVPEGAEKLDFRGVQGFDANTAVIMASGKGEASKIYKTTDGCQTWKLVFENPDEAGFFDALRKVTPQHMYLMGDPVDGKFSMFYSPDRGSTWFIADDPGLEAGKDDGAFAASNSGFIAMDSTFYFATGGGAIAHLYGSYGNCPEGAGKNQICPMAWKKQDLPLAAGSSGAGIFSLAGRITLTQTGKQIGVLVAVGGDYVKPIVAEGTAAWSNDGGKTWSVPAAGPRGYRSAVAFDRATHAWVAVGPSGTDVSFDDGKDWKAVAGDTAEGWNAVSLPFVVGRQGRIGKIRSDVLKP